MHLLHLTAAAGLLASAWAHGTHAASQKPVVADDADWITKHMAGEHHIGDFDADSFFTLHDFDGDGFWSASEIERTYGLEDRSNAGMAPDARARVAPAVLKIYDANHDGRVSRDEWRVIYGDRHQTLPDLGTGPGHHGDDEYEYEIHHWEQFHDENTKLEDLTHPEDIEHFRYHEELEEQEERDEAARVARAEMPIVWDNVPTLFRRAKAM